MDFNLTEERQMLSDMLTRFLTEQYQLEHRNSVAYDAPFHDPSKWKEMARLGVFAALANETDGGLAGSGADIAVVFKALGHALNCEPTLPLLMSSRLLSGAEKDQAALLEGTVHYAVAIAEPDAPYNIADIIVTASDDHRLSGRKTSVYGGNIADQFLVAAKAGELLNLYQVEAKDAEVIPYGLIDGGGAAEVLFDNTKAELLVENAKPQIQDAIDAGIVGLCSEAVGIMTTTHQITVDYLKNRKQFGRSIGSFQVLQHRAVDMLIEIEQSRSITIKAAYELGGPNASRFSSMAKYMIGQSGRLVAEEAIQMHGGIAMTWDYAVSHYAKRLIMIDHQLGDMDFHLSQITKTLDIT